MKKFISLRVEHPKLDNLAGLCDETIAVAVPWMQPCQGFKP